MTDELDLNPLDKIKLAVVRVARDMDEVRSAVSELKVSEAVNTKAIERLDATFGELRKQLSDLQSDISRIDGRTERGDLIVDVNNEVTSSSQANPNVRVGDEKTDQSSRSASGIPPKLVWFIIILLLVAVGWVSKDQLLLVIGIDEPKQVEQVDGAVPPAPKITPE